jgi:hypothetical protein
MPTKLSWVTVCVSSAERRVNSIQNFKNQKTSYPVFCTSGGVITQVLLHFNITGIGVNLEVRCCSLFSGYAACDSAL